MATDGPPASGDDVAVALEGSLTWGRFQWLQSDLQKVAVEVAQDCHEFNIDPVVRVGGGASGYASLHTNSGVTDSSAIKHFPWDVFVTYLNSAYSAVQPAVSELPETHLYGTVADAEVEHGAIAGEDDDLTKVISVAAGEDQSHAARAKAVLAQVPEEELEHWNEAHKK